MHHADLGRNDNHAVKPILPTNPELQRGAPDSGRTTQCPEEKAPSFNLRDYIDGNKVIFKINSGVIFKINSGPDGNMSFEYEVVKPRDSMAQNH